MNLNKEGRWIQYLDVLDHLHRDHLSNISGIFCHLCHPFNFFIFRISSLINSLLRCNCHSPLNNANTLNIFTSLVLIFWEPFTLSGDFLFLWSEIWFHSLTLGKQLIFLIFKLLEEVPIFVRSHSPTCPFSSAKRDLYSHPTPDLSFVHLPTHPPTSPVYLPSYLPANLPISFKFL